MEENELAACEIPDFAELVRIADDLGREDESVE